MTEEEKDSIEILENTDLDINTIDCIDLHTYNYAVKTALNLIQKQQKEIEKKDKMIDLMAEYIGKIDDETFCNDDKYERDIEDNVIGCDEDCEECVKQYFERKINDVKN